MRRLCARTRTGSAFALADLPSPLPVPRCSTDSSFSRRANRSFPTTRCISSRRRAEHEIFSAGELAPTVAAPQGDKSDGLRVSGGICYDLRFPELFRGPFRDGANLLCVSAQWPTPRIDHWVALCVARAIENQCYVLSSNRTGEAFIGRRQKRLEFPGNSMVVSPYGEILAKGGDEPGLVSADIDLDQVRQFRTRVPVTKDDRPDLYRRWADGAR